MVGMHMGGAVSYPFSKSACADAAHAARRAHFAIRSFLKLLNPDKPEITVFPHTQLTQASLPKVDSQELLTMALRVRCWGIPRVRDDGKHSALLQRDSGEPYSHIHSTKCEASLVLRPLTVSLLI